MKKQLYIILFALLLTGCVPSLQQGWNNFTAYYNTFYNAKQSFNEGLELNQRQRSGIDPTRPIRIHEKPTEAGAREFERAIEKNASILRNHNQSDYVIRAVAMIGKSYYYRQEYFSALEKFQELYGLATETEQNQEAVIWQGRTYLELESFDEGIRTLERELEYIEGWDPQLEAEAYAVLAQLYVAKRNWTDASLALYSAVEAMENQRLKARAYFLHGQVQERMGNNYQALAAYRLASNIHDEYDIEFNSLRKLAEMFRVTGDYDSAMNLYRALERDDKFLEHHTALRYDQARTHQVKGDTERAIRQYNQILHDRFNPPSDQVKARSYFGLGEIYRDDLNDFQLAAAYFDSASSQRVDLSEVYDDQDARELARTFGEYASLKQEISNLDSLLYLASLDTDELDSLLAELHRQQLEELESEPDRFGGFESLEEDTVVDAAEAMDFGFLNINDPTRLARAKMQFRDIWGDRPLTDNWRRENAISTLRTIENEIPGRSDNEFAGTEAERFNETAIFGVDLSEIPFTEEEKNVSKREKIQLQYRLGNLFFLSLNMPDSARAYFADVINSSQNPTLRPRAIYSMAELELTQGNRERAEGWARKLLNEYPESPYTIRLTDRMEDEQQDSDLAQSSRFEARYARIHQITADTGYVEKADQLLDLAEETADLNRKVMLMYEAAEYYIHAAKEVELSNDRADSLGVEQQADEVTFQGEYWDRAQSVLERITDLLPDSPQAERARELLDYMEEHRPDPVLAENRSGLIIEQVPRERYPSDPAGELPVCSEEGIELDLAGGAGRIVDELYLSDTQKDLLPDLVHYRFAILPDGTVENFELLEEGVPREIQQIFNRALEDLSFIPFEGEYSIRCRVPFPIRS